MPCLHCDLMADLAKLTECRGPLFFVAELSYGLSHSLQMGCETALTVSNLTTRSRLRANSSATITGEGSLPLSGL